MKKRANKAIGYIRVSTNEQAKEGYSLPAQKEKIIHYCSQKEIDLIDIIEDPGITTDIPFVDREGGKKIFKLIESKDINRIVTIKLDRIFREFGECITTVSKWKKEGVSVTFTDSNVEYNTDSSSELHFHIEAVLSHHEKRKIKERTKSVMEYMKKIGMYTGGRVIYGFRVNRENKLEPYPPEQDIINMIVQYHNNNYSIYGIIKILKEYNLKSRTGNDFSPNQVKQILKNYLLTEAAKIREPNNNPIEQYTGGKEKC